MDTSSLFVIFVILLALGFDFTNGFHDASNSIATIVATHVLTPMQAVIWAAFFNFIAFLVFKLAVATTIGSGLIQPNVINPILILSALLGAISWNLLTWYYGIPSSSSHALIGGLSGAALAFGGLQTLQWSGFIKVILAIILSPLIGLIMGFLFTLLVNKLTKNNSEATNNRWFKRLQLFSSALLSLTHGGNDAQKTMGIITALLYSSGWLGDTFYVPFWVVISCHLVIALGTLSGGWRIVKTMGYKITKLTPLKGCCAETGAALVIYAATNIGAPVSTTHCVAGSIAGVGMAQGLKGTRWFLMRRIFLTWVITIPGTALVSGVLMFLLKQY